jgi:hypothetical protein
MEALLPIINSRRYKAFDNISTGKFYSLPRATIMGARSVWHFKMLVNEQSLTTIMKGMSEADWLQWAMDRLN